MSLIGTDDDSEARETPPPCITTARYAVPVLSPPKVSGDA